MKALAFLGIETRSTTRYALAVLAAAAALLLRQLLSPFLGESNPYHTAWPAVIFTAWYCGLGPAIVATLISLIGVWYWFIPVFNSFELQDPRTEVPGMVGFLVFSGCIIALGEAHRRELIKRRQTKRALHQAQRLARMGNWMWDPQSETATWSEGVYRICGFDPKRPAPSFAEQKGLYGPESWQRLQAAVQRTQQTGEGYDLELEMFRPNGTEFWAMVHAEPELDKSPVSFCFLARFKTSRKISARNNRFVRAKSACELHSRRVTQGHGSGILRQAAPVH
jgi:PAS domain-containing protein